MSVRGPVAASLVALAAAVAPGSVVSVGAAAPVASKVTVPNVVGRLQAPAQAQLRRAHLRPSVVHVHSLRLVGTVVAERPRAGAKVRTGSRVALSVSSGPGP